MRAAYIFFWAAMFFPFYTYFLYPVVLNRLPEKKRSYRKDYKTSALILIYSEDITLYELKKAELSACGHSLNRIEYQWVHCAKDINCAVKHTDCDIVIFLNEKYEYDLAAIDNLAIPFSDKDVGCVVGMQRKPLTQEGHMQDGLFWRYENQIRILESRIGCVSGANNSIYAVQRKLYSDIPDCIKNIGFFISTSVQQKNADVVFEPFAIAYEKQKNDINTGMKKHVEDAIGYWQAFFIFRKMPLSQKRSFVYISHRVIKWLVPLNMFTSFCSTILLLERHPFYEKILWAQIFLYLIAGIWLSIKTKIKLKNPIFKLLDIISDFLELNISYTIGFIKFMRSKNRDA